MTKLTREEVIKLEVEILEKGILELRGKIREEAMKTYRKLLLSLPNKPIHLMRSE